MACDMCGGRHHCRRRPRVSLACALTSGPRPASHRAPSQMPTRGFSSPCRSKPWNIPSVVKTATASPLAPTAMSPPSPGRSWSSRTDSHARPSPAPRRTISPTVLPTECRRNCSPSPEHATAQDGEANVPAPMHGASPIRPGHLLHHSADRARHGARSPRTRGRIALSPECTAATPSQGRENVNSALGSLQRNAAPHGTDARAEPTLSPSALLARYERVALARSALELRALTVPRSALLLAPLLLPLPFLRGFQLGSPLVRVEPARSALLQPLLSQPRVAAVECHVRRALHHGPGATDGMPRRPEAEHGACRTAVALHHARLHLMCPIRSEDGSAPRVDQGAVLEQANRSFGRVDGRAAPP
eukprot:scaffold7161_cov109-Isochrysis_galbana.AAC.8